MFSYLMSKVDPCLFMSKTVICVVCVDDCLFWAHSQSEIDNVMKSFKCKRKPGWTMRKFKARYCVRGDIQKRLSPKPLNSYSTVVQWATVRLMLILQCIIGLRSQSIDFTNAFAQADITSG